LASVGTMFAAPLAPAMPWSSSVVPSRLSRASEILPASVISEGAAMPLA